MSNVGRFLSGSILAAGGACLTISLASAQPPQRPGPDRPGPRGPAPDAGAFVKRMLTRDANQDGKLSKDEVKDARLLPLFERADADHDGVVTTEELTTLHGKEVGRGGPDGGGPGPGGPGPDGPGGRGPGPGGPGMGGPPPVGEVLPGPVRERLRLSGEQLKKIDQLQKLVDSNLDQILTDEQKQQMKEMRNRGPGGPNVRRGPPPGEGGRPVRPQRPD